MRTLICKSGVEQSAFDHRIPRGYWHNKMLYFMYEMQAKVFNSNESLLLVLRPGNNYGCTGHCHESADCAGNLENH